MQSNECLMLWCIYVAMNCPSRSVSDRLHASIIILTLSAALFQLFSRSLCFSFFHGLAIHRMKFDRGSERTAWYLECRPATTVTIVSIRSHQKRNIHTICITHTRQTKTGSVQSSQPMERKNSECDIVQSGDYFKFWSHFIWSMRVSDRSCSKSLDTNFRIGSYWDGEGRSYFSVDGIFPARPPHFPYSFTFRCSVVCMRSAVRLWNKIIIYRSVWSWQFQSPNVPILSVFSIKSWAEREKNDV